MSAIHGIEGLIKWIKGDEWRNDFEAVFDRHVGPACRCRSAVRSSKRMADDYGRAPTRPAAPSFNSHCPAQPAIASDQ